MNVLSLFDGMSCGQQALERCGIKVNQYFASEIDKYAIKVTQANYPNTIQLGSVIDVYTHNLPKIDLLMGGSPCQSFSFAGKRKGMSTKDEQEILTLDHYLQLKQEGFEFEGQSYLFWEYMRILTDLRKVNPDVKFLLENVMMGEKWEKILTRAIGINPIEINSALVSAQNRRRLYWTNIGAIPDGLFGELYCKTPQPKDKGILLKDILEKEVDEKYYLSDSAIEGILKHKQEQKQKGYGFGAVIKTEDEKMNSLKIGGKGVDDLVKINKQGKVSPNQDKASCFTEGGHSGGNHSDMDLIVHNTMPRSSKSGKGGTGPLSRADGKTYCLDTGNTNAVEIVAMRGRGEKGNIEQQLETNRTNKRNSLTTVQKDNLVIQLNPSKESRGRQPYQQNRVYDENGIMTTLDTDSGRKSVLTNSRIRRLTPTECERLQTVKDGYTAHVSDSQRYKMIGNGWTIDVIAHIFSYI